MRRFMLLVVAVVSMASMGVAATAGAQTQHTKAGTVTIGALYLDVQGFFGGIKKGIQVGATSQHVKLLGSNSQGDASKEASFMSTLIGAHVQAIITSPVSATASVPLIRSAAKAGIPVVCYNTCIDNKDAKKYVKALVTTDQKKFGAAIGAAAAQYFKQKGITAPKIAILNCDIYEACLQRKVGFKAALSAALPGTQYVSDQQGFVADKAQTVATDVLTAHPDVDAFWAANEGGTIGEVLAVKSSGGKQVVFGEDIDTQIANFLLTDSNILIATNAQTPQLMGKLAVQIALRAIRHQPIKQYLVYTPTQVYQASQPAAVKTWLQVHKDGLP